MWMIKKKGVFILRNAYSKIGMVGLLLLKLFWLLVFGLTLRGQWMGRGRYKRKWHPRQNTTLHSPTHTKYLFGESIFFAPPLNPVNIFFPFILLAPNLH